MFNDMLLFWVFMPIVDSYDQEVDVRIAHECLMPTIR